MIKRIVLLSITVVGLALANVANASLIYATDAENVVVGTGQGTANDRDNINNLFGEADGKFYELGLGGSVDLLFGSPSGQPFGGSGFITEVTFGNVSNYLESVDIYVSYLGGVFEFVKNVTNVGAQTGAEFLFGGPFDTMRIVDTTPSNSRSSGGFDIDSVSVTQVSAPASLGIMGAALLALPFFRRRPII